ALRGGKLLKAETLKRAWTRGKLDNGTEFGYGLGWFVQEGKWGPAISHSGGWPGFMSYHLRLQKLTVILLRNWFHVEAGNPVLMANRLAAAVLDGPATVKEPLSASQAKQLAGVYQADKSRGAFTVTVGEGKDGLTMRFSMIESYALVRIGPQRFALPDLGDGFYVQFALEGGKVARLTLEQPKGLPTIVLRPATGLTNSVKDFDKEIADRVAG